MNSASGTIALCTAADMSPHALAETLNAGYESYAVPMQFDAPMVETLLAADSCDLGASVIARVDGDVVGCALVGRRGSRTRLGAMGVALPMRGKGVGRAMLSRVIEQSKSRQDTRLELEVIEGNTSAIGLYENMGFTTQRRLTAFERTEPGGGEPAELEDVPQEEAAAAINEHAPDDLPWQISGQTLLRPRDGYIAHRLEKAWVIVVDTPKGPRAVRGMCVERDARRQGQATRMIKALVERYADRGWMAPALCPADLVGDLFLKAGFTQADISQRHMIFAG